MPRATQIEMLRQQYGFLRRSIDAAMQGHDDEALRIATTLRVLVHESGASKPLLKQVNPNYLQITILDIPPRDLSRTVLYVGIAFQLNSETGVRPVIDLKNAPPDQRLVLLGEWWNRIMLVFAFEDKRVTFTRKELIVTLANKEGGAHVDTKLPPQYERFVLDSPFKIKTGGVDTDTIHLARFAAIRSGAEMCECLERNFPAAVGC